MATTGDKLYANSVNSAIFYTAGGVVQELAPNCLLSTFEVETVDGTGKPTKLKYPTSSGAGGDATAANQITGNNSLATIATNTTISKNTGVVDANTTRVTIATDGALMTTLGLQADSPASSDSGSFSVVSFIKRGLANWTTLLARIPVLVSGMFPVIASGRTTMVGATITRSANTTAYSVNQVVANANGTILTFTNLARITGGSGYITKARLVTNQLNNTASFRLHLFHTAPTSQADGSAYQLLWANRDKAIGTIDIPALTSEGAGGSTDSSRGMNSDIRLAFSGGATADIFVIVQTLSAFTPTSGQLFYLELTAENN